jgi:hypothetical protein
MGIKSKMILLMLIDGGDVVPVVLGIGESWCRMVGSRRLEVVLTDASKNERWAQILAIS